MNAEQLSIPEMEKRVWGLQGQIIEGLKSKGGDPSIRLKAVGTELACVVSRSGEAGFEALYLGVDGKWSGRFDMTPFDISNQSPPTLPDLLEGYAGITDMGFKRLRYALTEESMRLDISTQEQAAREFARQQEERKLYIEQHQSQLLSGLVDDMERTFQQLSS